LGRPFDAEGLKKVMARKPKKSFFDKVKNYVLDKDDEEESAEDIDRRLAAELTEIEEMETETVDGDDVIKGDLWDSSDVVYVMDLGPLYNIVGGRKSMLGKRLADACENIFDRLVPRVEGSARKRSDLFIMSFSYPSKEEGFRKAAQVINDIGTQTIGDQFTTLEIPNLLVAAEPAALSGADGELDLEKAKAEMESGGIGVELGQPNPDDPEWLQFSAKKAIKAAAQTKAASAVKSAEQAGAAPGTKSAAPAKDINRPRRKGDPGWADERTDRRVRISYDPMRMERRRGSDRRVNK